MLRASKLHDLRNRNQCTTKKHDESTPTSSSNQQYILYAIIAVLTLYIIHLRFSSPINFNSDINTSFTQTQATPSSTSAVSKSNLHFWGNTEFDSDTFIEGLSSIVDTDTLETCKSIMTQYDLKRKDIWSQAYQEWYLYHNFFYGKTNGIYLDIGAHKPLHLSNSAFFDLCLGWKGICVEPTETSKLFQEHRSCTVARRCVSSETKPMIMLFRSDGDASMIIDEKERDRIKQENPERVQDLFECDAIDATDLLNGYKVRDRNGEEMNIMADETVIDFISLDVEGAEVDFLSCFPFHHYEVKVWVIEINKNESPIDEIMLRNGYLKFEHLTQDQWRLDAVYVKKSVMGKYPWTDQEEWDKWSKFKRCTKAN